MLKYKVKQIDGKLILTFSDIKVGDKAYEPNVAPNQGLTYEGGEKWTNDFGDDVYFSLSDETLKFYKVIGEISSDATWVTEGMEFGEDEVKNYYNFDTGLSHIKIKGPCGHFH